MQEVAEIYVAQCQYKLLFWHWNVSKKKFQSKFQGQHDLSFMCDDLKNLSILLAPNHIIHIFFSLPCLGNTSFKRLNSSGLHWFVIASWIFVNSSLAAAFCCSILSLNKNVSERVNNRTAIVFKNFWSQTKLLPLDEVCTCTLASAHKTDSVSQQQTSFICQVYFDNNSNY